MAHLKSRVSRLIILICLIVFGMFVYTFRYQEFDFDEQLIMTKSFVLHEHIVKTFYDKHQNLRTSNLGSILFKNVDMPVDNKSNKTFVILFWKHWGWLQNRHVFNYGSTKNNPLEDCSVQNCQFTGNDSVLDTADAVVVHLQRGLIPKVQHRNPDQRWIFLTDESAMHTFTGKRPKLTELTNIFNWSMTYRSDADIPVPYGRTIALSEPVLPNIQYSSLTELAPNWENKKRDVLAAVLMSNCGVPRRMKFLNELKKFIKVDVYGKCGDGSLKESCPGHFRADCEPMSNYLFYLVLENSMCLEYMTEKLFYHAYSKGAIPIIHGPSLEDCELLLPPNSFIHVDSYPSVEALAKAVVDISENDEKLLSYHLWRNHFDINNEHGYFGSKSYHLCRVCEALNYNDKKQSVYDEERIKMFLDPSRSCR